MSVVKHVMVCRGNTPQLLAMGVGYLDDDQLYDLLATTDPAAMAGAGGEVVFFAIYVALKHEHEVVIKVTPIVDDVVLTAHSYTLARPTARARRILKVPLLEALPSSVTGFATLGHQAPRGCWIQAKVESVHIAEVRASLTTALTGANNDLVFTAAVGLGKAGNSVTIRYVNPGTPSAALSVVVVGSAITVNLATNGSSVVTTTAANIITAIAASGAAAALVSAANAPANTGVGVVIALAATALTGGVDGPGYIAIEGAELEHKVVRESLSEGSNK